MAHVITLTGTRISGKSMAAELFDEMGVKRIKVMKERPPRVNEEENGTGESRFGPVDPEECDLAYEWLGKSYGLNSAELYDRLAKGISTVVILSDVRVVELVRMALGPLVRSILIYRKRPCPEYRKDLREVARKREETNEKGEVDEDKIQEQYLKAHIFHRIYIENLHLFDHVILNVGEEALLRQQVKSITESLGKDPDWPLK